MMFRARAIDAAPDNALAKDVRKQLAWISTFATARAATH
jgi:hypothetical protein